jgi:hypothetical protein
MGANATIAIVASPTLKGIKLQSSLACGLPFFPSTHTRTYSVSIQVGGDSVASLIVAYSNMPLPVPCGVLAESHRVCCLRCLQGKKKKPEHASFIQSMSKKCAYCTEQNAVCVPVSTESESGPNRC